MTTSFKALKQILHQTDPMISFPLCISMVIFTLLHLTFFLLSPILPSQLPIFYSTPWGQTQLANKHYYLLLPAMILIVTVLNTALAWRLHSSQVILKRLLFLTIVAVDFIILIAGVKIITIFI